MATEPTIKKARMIRKADIIKVKMTPDTDPVTEVVRDVTMTFHMANGIDIRVAVTDDIPVVPPEELPSEGE